MWGFYYLCADCGWTAEDDDSVIGARPGPKLKGPFPAYTDITPPPRREPLVPA
jgi:hypothetical protein